MIRLVELPKSVEGLMTEDVYSKARSYDLDRLKFSNLKDIYSKLLTTVWNLIYFRLSLLKTKRRYGSAQFILKYYKYWYIYRASC